MHIVKTLLAGGGIIIAIAALVVSQFHLVSNEYAQIK